MLHAMTAARDFKRDCVEVSLFFHGIGVVWLKAFDEKADKYTQHYAALFEEVKDVIGGACNFCSVRRFDAEKSTANLGVALVGEADEHHTIADLVKQGYQPITF